MIKTKLFFVSLVAATTVLLAFFYFTRPAPFKPIGVAEDVFVSPQLESRDVPVLKRNGIHTIVDLRPDGEAANQIPSETMKDIAQANGMSFNYIPVPHEEIPDKAVTELSEVLLHEPKPFVLYCRTGRRAARTFALVEASRADGPNWDDIKRMVADAGFSADDLKDRILSRIAKRKTLQAARN